MRLVIRENNAGAYKNVQSFLKIYYIFQVTIQENVHFIDLKNNIFTYNEEYT